MNVIKVGDIVVRRSYGGDIYFRVKHITRSENGDYLYTLKGMFHRLEADSHITDLVRQNPLSVKQGVLYNLKKTKRYAHSENPHFFPFMSRKLRAVPGKVLHIDADRDFMQTCFKYYREAGITAIVKAVNENEQPYYIRQLLGQYKPEVLVITGHDGIKKNSGNINSMDNYRNSKYYVQSTREARIYEPDPDKLCIFAGACQSYFEAIMDTGANFASSPGRVLINALDPAIVSEKVALTDQRNIVTPNQISRITYSGSKGIGGINTKGRMK